MKIFKNFTLILIGILIVLFLSIVFAEDTKAFGIISKPIIIENALRGETIKESLKIFNSKNEVDVFNLVASGDVADWIKFYNPNDLNNPITKATGTAESYFDTVLLINIPEDISNGEYIGKITVSTVPSEDEGKGAVASVSQKLSREIKIKVTDTERVMIETSIIANSFGLEENQTLKIRIIYDNQGNVSLKPQIQVKVRNSINQDVVYNAIFPYPDNLAAVMPLAQQEVPIIEIPTTGMKSGAYVADLEFLHNNNVILKKNFNFTIRSKQTFLGFIKNINLTYLKYGAIVFIFIIIALIFTLLKKTSNQKLKLSDQKINRE